MIKLEVHIKEIRPGVLMLHRQPSAEVNVTEAEVSAVDRINNHIQAGLDEEQKRMGADGWAESTEAPASILSDTKIAEIKQRMKDQDHE